MTNVSRRLLKQLRETRDNARLDPWHTPPLVRTKSSLSQQYDICRNGSGWTEDTDGRRSFTITHWKHYEHMRRDGILYFNTKNNNNTFLFWKKMAKHCCEYFALAKTWTHISTRACTTVWISEILRASKRTESASRRLLKQPRETCDHARLEPWHTPPLVRAKPSLSQQYSVRRNGSGSTEDTDG